MPPYSPGGPTWISPSGFYTIRMQSYGYRTFIYAVAAGNFTNSGLPVVGCYNSQEDILKVHILKKQIPYLNPYGPKHGHETIRTPSPQDVIGSKMCARAVQAQIRRQNGPESPKLMIYDEFMYQHIYTYPYTSIYYLIY